MSLACLWIAAAVVKIAALALAITPAMEAAILAGMVAAAAGTALVQSRILGRKRSVDPALRRSFRLHAAATLIFTTCAVATALSYHVPPGMWKEVVLRISTLGSIPGLFIALGATLKLPGGEISRANRAPAFLDLGTLFITSLLAFWIFALWPALHRLVSAPAVAAVHQAAKPGLPVPVAAPPAGVTVSDPAQPESGPAATASNEAPASSKPWSVNNAEAIIVIAAYAFVSILILSMALLIPFRGQESVSHRGLGYVALGSVAMILGDVIPLCGGFARGGPLPPHPTFIGWILFCIAFAIHAQVSRERQTSRAENVPHELRFSMPFASIGLVAMVLFILVIERDLLKEHIDLLLPAVFLAFVFVIVRQTVIARENFGLALEMQRAKEIAESANSARLQFLANISHDLRTPLNGVLGCAQILLREKAFSPKNRELLKTIQGCGEHLRNLINDLLDLSKLEAGRLELAPSPFDLKSFLKALIKTFELEAENKKIALDLEEANNLPGWVQCDRKRLQQILGNLVHNAIKFTDHGRVKLRARIAGPAMIFDVIDTGCGILPDKIGELFQPFHVVDERSIKLEGTGLGLSISKKLANKMGGDIFVNSTLGKGSTFTVAIPLVETAPVVEVQRTVVDYQGRRRRILIVDDNSANRVVLRTMLEPLDFLIHEASDATTAHEQIHQATPDIILMDLMMPGIDGFMLCRQVIAKHIMPAPAIIAVSAMAGDDVVERCRKAGFADLLNKPVHLETLVETLRAHAGVEWTYGVLQPAPEAAAEPISNEPFVAPPAEEVSAFLDLARRGVVRNIETRAEQLAHSHPEYMPFARRVARYAREFKLKELGEWLSSLSSPQPHGST